MNRTLADRISSVGIYHTTPCDRTSGCRTLKCLLGDFLLNGGVGCRTATQIGSPAHCVAEFDDRRGVHRGHSIVRSPRMACCRHWSIPRDSFRPASSLSSKRLQWVGLEKGGNRSALTVKSTKCRLQFSRPDKIGAAESRGRIAHGLPLVREQRHV